MSNTTSKNNKHKRNTEAVVALSRKKSEETCKKSRPSNKNINQK